jgi:hypothetical protein
MERNVGNQRSKRETEEFCKSFNDDNVLTLDFPERDFRKSCEVSS